MGVKLLGGIPHLPNFPVSEELVRVKIRGAVKESGWYDLSKESLVIEGIKKAGGALLQADLGGINLGPSLKDKEEIWVSGEKVNINRASLEQLVYLPGIGFLARRIVEYREQKDGFRDLSELKKVPGIGKVKLEKITLDGSS